MREGQLLSAGVPTVVRNADNLNEAGARLTRMVLHSVEGCCEVEVHYFIGEPVGSEAVVQDEGDGDQLIAGNEEHA